jgi:hypothetical protein
MLSLLTIVVITLVAVSTTAAYFNSGTSVQVSTLSGSEKININGMSAEQLNAKFPDAQSVSLPNEIKDVGSTGTLKIVCDKNLYTGFEQIETICNITNPTDKQVTSAINLIFFPNNKANIYSVKQWQKNVEHQITRIISEPIYNEKEITANATCKAPCMYKWTSYKLTTTTTAEYYDDFTEIPENTNTVEGVTINPGETESFKFIVAIEPNTNGKFDIKYSDTSLDPWWDSTYTYRYLIIENKTTDGTIAVNDTFGIHNDTIVWALTHNDSYVYSTTTTFSSIAIANTTNQKYWENETSTTGNNVSGAFPDAYAVWHFGQNLNDTIGGSSSACKLTFMGTNPPVYNNTGRFLYGVSFNNASDYLQSGTGCMDETTTFSSNMTISIWIKFNARYIAGSSSMTILTKHSTGSGGGIYLNMEGSTGKAQLRFEDGTTYYDLDSTTAVWEANKWYNIVATYDSVNTRLYVNGTYETQIATPGWSEDNTPLYFGMNYALSGGDFYGMMDEARVYNITLSPTEITNQYNVGLNQMSRLGSLEEVDRVDITNNTANTTSTPYGSTFTTNITARNHTASTTVDSVWFEFNGVNITGQEVVDLGNGGIYNFTTSLFVPAGTYTIKQFANDTTGVNYTNATTYFDITVTALTNNTISLTSTSWSVSQGTSTTVTCVAGIGTATLYRNGIPVTNPETTALGIGSYNYSCLVSATGYADKTSEHILTVTPGGSECSDSSVYLYGFTTNNNANQIVFNLTNYVNQHLVRNDLNDVLSATSGITVYKSIIGSNYYIMVNQSNVTNPFTIYFGNYISNNSLSNVSITNTTMTSFTPTLVTPYYYTVDTIDEMSSIRQIPPGVNTTRMTLYCTNGSTTFNVNDTQFTIPAYSQLSRMRYTVTYSATEVYYRDLLITSPYEYKTFYMADAIAYQVLQIIMKLQDNTLDYRNATLHIKKTIGSTWVTITELSFDAEKKAIIYLIDGQQYQVTVTNPSGDERVIGNLYADSVNLDKTIVINDELETNAYKGNTSMNYTYNNVTGVIEFRWQDPEGNTNLTEMYVYNYTNKSQLMFYGSCSNPISCTMTYTVPNTTQAYLVNMKVHHYIYGLNTLDITVVLGWVQDLIENVLPAISNDVKGIMGAIFIIILVMVFAAVNSATGGVIVSLMAAMLSFLQILPMNNYVLALAVFLAIVNKATERKVVS